MALLSTTALLAANAVWRPANPIDTNPIDTNIGGATRLRCVVQADQAGQFGVEQSDDGVVWFVTLGPNAVAASTTFDTFSTASIFESLISLRFVRPVYVNGNTNQGAFSLLANVVAG